jgi:hypothetical protein
MGRRCPDDIHHSYGGRNSATQSRAEQCLATMTTRFFRHGDILTVTASAYPTSGEP